MKQIIPLADKKKVLDVVTEEGVPVSTVHSKMEELGIKEPLTLLRELKERKLIVGARDDRGAPIIRLVGRKQ